MRCACLVAVILVVACKEKQETKPAPPPPPPAPAVEKKPAAETPTPAEPSKPAIKPAGGINTAAEYESKALDLTDKLIAVFAGSGPNCDKLAHNLERFLEDNKDAITATDQFEAVNPSAEDDLEPKLQSKVRPLIEKMTFSMQKCEKHQGVQAALAKLPD